eukprot:EG_transcript_53002
MLRPKTNLWLGQRAGVKSPPPKLTQNAWALLGEHLLKLPKIICSKHWKENIDLWVFRIPPGRSRPQLAGGGDEPPCSQGKGGPPQCVGAVTPSSCRTLFLNL